MGSTGPATTSGRSKRRLSTGTGIVGLLAGLLFATNASVFTGPGAREPQDLEGLVRAETERYERTESENAELRAQIDGLAQDGADSDEIPQGDAPAAAVGLEAVHGPGVEVQLWDAPALPDDAPGNFAPDDIVVHQQDLEAVMNALWAGGAEAMSVQGHRVVSTTGVRCVGNVLHIAGRTYSPPYVVQAIGDPAALRAGLDSSPGVQVYRQYVDAVGLGWSMTEQVDMELPAYVGSLAYQHAQVIGDAH